ncbi:hypothetical protein [Hymenobacter sp. CRA2]|uniref:hypothetical protein n=1 Tax=Hymenobacter sp. CRA2 TaxID=1955620 RepID=UPI00098F595E|nr:hypothetical protein [Hymenobacter sp. CRA2]OON68356.1 hypothetical protein B0919_14505 [Hymenobacter sp. CRA2]
MTRLLLLLVFALCFAHAARAQDILTKRTGDELSVKVLEVTPTEIRYKRTDNPDGPLFVVMRADVFMIKYANGTKEVMNAAPGASMSAAGASPLPPGTKAVVGDGPAAYDGVRLSGPRLGFTVLTGGAASYAEREFNVNPFLTQFGWQFETRLFRMPNGTSGLFEFVPLIGGLEQGKFIPSVNALLGVRGPKGFEVGLGPNITPVSVGVALAAGTTIRTASGINFPITAAVVPGNDGVRLSLLMGFTTRRP